MNNNHFDNAVRIAAFRGIAGRLFENNLISQAEFNTIQRKLNKEDHMLIAGCQHGKYHARKICEKSQVQNGLDSFARESDD